MNFALMVFSIFEPDMLNGPFGYLETDLNGSGYVNGSD
jgi:hypothetical protein